MSKNAGLSPERKQMILGIGMGIFFGVLISWLTGFWYWLPAGIAVGVASGAILKPPKR